MGFLNIAHHVGGRFGALVADAVIGFLGQDVDHALESRPFADRQQHGDKFIIGETHVQRIHGALETGVFAVNLVHHHNNRLIELVSELPSQFGAHFGASHCIDCHQHAVGDAHRIFHLALKVGITRGIQQIDLVILKFERN